MENKTQLLKVIVGSQAHGLAGPNSDFDYRGVFVVPTHAFLTIPFEKIHNTQWIEGKEDDTSWEIGHFLNMAIHCNPTVLETFLAPMVPERKVETLFKETNNVYGKYAEELRSLFPYVWNSLSVKEAFIGYGHNQQKKMLDEKDKRPNKYAAAYLRVLYNCYELLDTGTFTVDLTGTPVFAEVKKYKAGELTQGEVIDTCNVWKKRIEEIYVKKPQKKSDLRPVNEFLLKIRKEFW